MARRHMHPIDLSTYGFRPPEADTIDWRALTNRREINSTVINYVELGDVNAPAILLIHGLSGSWLNWKQVIPLLAKSHRVIAVDLPGFGQSPLPDQPISIASYAHLVDGLCDVLGLNTATIVGNSMGGYVAVQIAAEHSSRVRSLVLSSPAGIATANMNAEQMIRKARQIASATRVVPQPVRRRLMQRGQWRSRVLLPFVEHGELLDPSTANELAQGAGSLGYPAAVLALSKRNVHDLAKRVTCPTLIIWGNRDRIIPVQHAERLASLIKGSEVEIFDDVGHLQMVEQPAAFAQSILRFVEPQA